MAIHLGRMSRDISAFRMTRYFDVGAMRRQWRPGYRLRYGDYLRTSGSRWASGIACVAPTAHSDAASSG